MGDLPPGHMELDITRMGNKIYDINDIYHIIFTHSNQTTLLNLTQGNQIGGQDISDHTKGMWS